MRWYQRNVGMGGSPGLSPWSYNLNSYNATKDSLFSIQKHLRDPHIKISEGGWLRGSLGKRKENQWQSWERRGIHFYPHSLHPEEQKYSKLSWAQWVSQNADICVQKKTCHGTCSPPLTLPELTEGSRKKKAVTVTVELLSTLSSTLRTGEAEGILPWVAEAHCS